MNDNELKQAFRAMAEGTDPRRAADAVRNRIASQAAAGGAREKKRKEFSMIPKKKNWTAVVAAAALVIVLTAAVAAAPILRNYINSLTLQEDSLRQLTEVPEGWIGVYTLDDLDAVREDLGGNYILMEDLSFEEGDFAEGGRFAGGWEPIGTVKEPFTGIFNGNGHTIDGLVIDAASASNKTRVLDGSSSVRDAVSLPIRDAVGLFGYVRAAGTRLIVEEQEVPLYTSEWVRNEDGTEEQVLRDTGMTQTRTVMSMDFSTWEVGGTVKNLRLRSGVIRFAYEPVARQFLGGEPGPDAGYVLQPHSAFVGPVAGYADYVLGCVTEDFRVEVTSPDSEETVREWEQERGTSLSELGSSQYCLNVGGVIGGSYLTDSCASSAEITVRTGGEVPNPSVGGIGGIMTACVTSYFDGVIDGDPGDSGIGTIREDDVPRVLSEDVMTELAIRLVFIDPGLSARAEDYEERTEALRREGVTAWTLPGYLREHGEGDIGEYGWYANKIMAFYCLRPDLSGSVQQMVTEDAAGREFYLLDPDTKPREYAELSKLIALAFPDNSFEDFCRENHVKYGCYYAYDLRSDPACEFDGFDFDAIWTCGEDGRLPVLRLFR